MAASNTLSAAELLIDPHNVDVAAVCVLAGDDGFLQHEARRALLRAIGDDAADSADLCDGSFCDLADVFDRLCELSLFADDRRVVVVEDADKFVRQYRGRLEDYVAAPRADATLVLEVSSWPGNTRLAKAVAHTGLVVRCAVPDKGREVAAFETQLKQWLAVEAKRTHGCELPKAAANRLLELHPPQPGILLQEIARLALLAGESKKIDAELVTKNVGSWRTRKAWDMIDAAAEGRAADALEQLSRLIASGEDPHGLLPQMASSLRKLAVAAQLFEQAESEGRRMSLRDALLKTGAPSFKIGDLERQLRQIGRERAGQLFDWLLTADLELKSHNSPRDRARRVLETLIVRLSRDLQVAPA